MNYQTESMQNNPYAGEAAQQMAASLQAQMVSDKKPIESGMETLEKAVAGIDATIAALDKRLGLVKRARGVVAQDGAKEGAVSSGSPLASYLQNMTARMNDVQRRLADLCQTIEL